ncbi:MAG: type I DNA topoisomerase [Flavobacteriaceae bacterium]|nr:type I DNA topoisomerase [Flavobacteriaceae bacterium]
MPKNLVIVESPAKAKTIEKFLGKDYKVASSYGHISDLPSRDLGVDVKQNFKPQYIVSSDKKEVVANLRKLSKEAEMVWLASDEDREGEAIAWHLAETLKLSEDKTKRIVFNQITKNAIEKAIENPRKIDYNLVNAQQARRVLDRLVGYELSPVLWKKIKPGLSAGRVQSVAVRLIVERERDIQTFKVNSTYKVEAIFADQNGKTFKAQLSESFDHLDQARKFLEIQTDADFVIESVEKKPAKKSPAAPFTTSTLQQEAARKLNFPVGITMRVAQRLYEQGLITYMRTDSVNLSPEAIAQAKHEVSASYGQKYSKSRNFSTKTKGAQEAHEAIRPTDISVSSIAMESDMNRLYDLIWKRTIASQMADAELERTVFLIKSNKENARFRAQGEVIVFDGFLKVYLEGKDDDNDDENETGLLPNLKKADQVMAQQITATERFSRPPARYSEAALVKKLEELGIGRPSTYAPTISTIQNRNYIEKGTYEGESRNFVVLTLEQQKIQVRKKTEITGSNKGKLIPTDIGYVVNDFLVNHFESILAYNFTAKVEQDFDEIAAGSLEWTKMMSEFYDVFHPKVEDVEQNADRESGERILGTDPDTGKPISVRLGRFGPMAQIGEPEDDDKKFASLKPDQNIGTITLQEALDLFKLPHDLGAYKNETLQVNIGRFGPYVRFGKSYISIPKDIDPLEVTLEQAVVWVEEKLAADAPIATYDGKPVQKGKGRFGPYLKWNNIFVNIPKAYDFENLSDEDIQTLISEKIRKDQEKLIKEWKEEGIKLEKNRYGKVEVKKGKLKKQLNPKVDAAKLTLEEAKALLGINKTSATGAKKKPASKKASKTKK